MSFNQEIGRQRRHDEIKAISPEIWPNLLELGRGTAREEMYRSGAIEERQQFQFTV
jgi:hypothetical protein